MALEYRIIVNPAAGGGKAGAQIPQLEAKLRAQGIKYDLALTEEAGHGIELARRSVKEGWPAVAAFGGDGTANEVINGLAGSKVPLGILPAGTGNDLARTLRIPNSLEDAVRILADPRVREIDLAEDQGTFFSSIAGIGFPADVMVNVNTSKGVFSGPPAILRGIVKTLKELTGIEVKLELDGEVKLQQVQGIFIMNTVYAGGGFKFSPQADYSDGLLDVLVMRDMSRLEVLGLLPRVYRGTHLSHPKVDFYRVKEVKVFPEAPVAKMLDGNITGQTPILAKVYHTPLRVLIAGNG